MEILKTKQFLLVLGISILNLGFQQESQAQCQPLLPLEVINGSFEGTPEPHVTPAPWNTCGITPDTQPGSWGVTLPASEGNSYVGFVYGNPTWREGVSQQLSGSMAVGVPHEFTIDLSATPASGGGINPSSFCSMEIWGADSICQMDELLWSSPTITHYGWQTYTVTFTPSQNFEFIYLISNSNGVNGYILLDNITPVQAITPIMEITSHVDGDSEDCNFTLTGSIYNAIVDSVVLTGNFQGSPLSTTLNGLSWSAPLFMNAFESQAIVATAYYTDQLLQDICVYTQVNLDISGPEVGFHFNSECENVEVLFTDTSDALSPNTIATWNWSFGDSGVSSLQNPEHIFTTSGMYQVVLEITSSNGCTAIDTQSIEIYEAPVSDFTFTEVCVGYTTNFHDFSTSATGILTDWQWDFGDGNLSTVSDPVYSYANSGAYQASLIVQNSIGCWDTLTQVVEVFTCTSINEVSENQLINIYSDPIRDVLNIGFSPTILSHVKKINLFNSSGQMVYSKNIDQKGIFSIPTSSFASGVFILEVVSTDIPSIRRKFLIH